MPILKQLTQFKYLYFHPMFFKYLSQKKVINSHMSSTLYVIYENLNKSFIVKSNGNLSTEIIQLACLNFPIKHIYSTLRWVKIANYKRSPTIWLHL